MSRLQLFGESIARLASPSTFRRLERVALECENAVFKANEAIGGLQALAREDPGWILMSTGYDHLFDREFLNELIKVSRTFFLKNPIIRRAVLLQSYYVFGRGVEIRCEEPKANEALQAFLQANRKQLGVTGLTESEQSVQNDGNLFYVAFLDPNLGTVVMRSIDALEIAEVWTNPQDADEPWYYRRVWNQKIPASDGTVSTEAKTAWYPAMSYRPSAGYLPTLKGFAVNTKQFVHHRKVGAPSKSLFGYPETFAAFDWASSYRRFIESWLTKEEALSRLALQIKTPGGSKAINAISNSVKTRIDGANTEHNPAPQTGAAWIGGPNQDIQTIKTSGSNTSPDEARRAFLMAIMLFGPETFFGDASVGSLATAQSLDRPTELKFLHAQERWKEDLSEICTFALEQGRVAPGGELKGKLTEPPKILVSFPPILEHDILAQVQAIVFAATLDGKGPSGTIDQRTLAAMLLHVLGVQDVSIIVDKMYPEADYNPQDWAASTPAERQAMASDIAAKAQIAANAPTESAGAAMLAAMVPRLVEVVGSAKR